MKPEHHPRVVLLSGPSGSGKSTIIRDALNRIPELRLSVSYTTRGKRESELEGKDYHFTDQEQFKAKIEAGDFLEWAEVFGEYYGTERAHVERLLAEGHHVLLDVDVQGAMIIKANCSGVVFIFLKPPSLEELEFRLRNRKSETEESLARRLAKAEHEISFAGQYDYVILNDYADRAAKETVKIIREEERRAVKFAHAPSAATAVAGSGEEVAAKLTERMSGKLRDEMIALINDRVRTVLQRDMHRLILDTFRKSTKDDT